MWRNYLTVGIRSLLKSRVYAVINILGLAIGLHAEPLDDTLRDELLRFWLHPLHWGARWREHEDINEVTLATALMPHGFLGHGVWEVPETHARSAHEMQGGRS